MSPNFLIMFSDEQRVDTIGCYGPAYGLPGNPTVRTPNIDALTSGGARFDACFTPYPLCAPARASLWTSLYPHEHDVLGNKRVMRLPDGLVPPVAALRDAGYYTGYAGKWHVPGADPHDLGFVDARALGRDWGRDIPEYRAYLRDKGYVISPHSVENLTPGEVELLRRPDTPSCGPSALPLEDYLEPWVTDRAIELLGDAAASGRPFLVVCSWNAPHFPMLVPAPYDRMYDPALVPLPPTFDDDLAGKPEAHNVRFSHTRVRHLTPDGWRRLIAHYWGLVSLVDAQAGRLTAALDRLGVAADTVVVYLADHGDMMGSHGLMEKGSWHVYEETVRIPLIVKGVAGQAVGRTVVPELVSLIDVLPTLLDLAGVGAPPGLSGQSAAPLLRSGNGRLRDAVFGETAWLSERPGADPALPQEELDPERTLMIKWMRTQRWKYGYYSNDLDELYDLTKDPLEMHSLAGEPEHEGAVKALRQRLLSWMEETHDPLLPKLRPGLLEGV